MYPLRSLEPKQNTIRDLVKKLGLDQITSLRIVYFIFIPGMIFPTLHISPESAVTIMNNLHLLVIGTVALIAFGEREKLQKRKFWSWIHYISILSIGVLTVEFIGLFTHVLASLFIAEGALTHEAEYWVNVATIFTGAGGIILGIIFFFSERIDKWIFSKVNEKYARLAAAGFVIIIASLSLWMNPQTQNFLRTIFG